VAGFPAPVTTTDVLLVALHTEIVGLRADLAAARGGEPADLGTGRVELREPVASQQQQQQPARTRATKGAAT
jgi:hypothetical protein